MLLQFPQKCPDCGSDVKAVSMHEGRRGGLKFVCPKGHQNVYLSPSSPPQEYPEPEQEQKPEKPVEEPKPRKRETKKCKPGPSPKTTAKVVASLQKVVSA